DREENRGAIRCALPARGTLGLHARAQEVVARPHRGGARALRAPDRDEPGLCARALRVYPVLGGRPGTPSRAGNTARQCRRLGSAYGAPSPGGAAMHDASPRELRRFALTVGGAFALLALVSWARGHEIPP